jgi:GNAT superfamily N-acetyltransferase
VNITYLSIPPEQNDLCALFLTTGWNISYGLEPQELHDTVMRSWFVQSAYAGDRLAGLDRIISDGVVHALILDLMVLPENQNQGIGARILAILVTKFQEHNIRDIQLFYTRNKQEFYSERGFRARPENVPGMGYNMPELAPYESGSI